MQGSSVCSTLSLWTKPSVSKAGRLASCKIAKATKHPRMTTCSFSPSLLQSGEQFPKFTSVIYLYQTCACQRWGFHCIGHYVHIHGIQRSYSVTRQEMKILALGCMATLWQNRGGGGGGVKPRLSETQTSILLANPACPPNMNKAFCSLLFLAALLC